MFVSVIKFFLDPFNLTWILLLVVVGVRIRLREKSALFRRLLILLCLWILIISTPPVPTLLLDSLERQYTPLTVGEVQPQNLEYHILVLGGGHGYDDRLPANSLLTPNALGRLNEAVRVYRILPNSTLVLSGSTSSPNRTTQAEMLYESALLLGIDEHRMLLQKEPRTSYEEAKIYTDRFGRNLPLILVTSAAHMPRAMKVFKHFGQDPIPSPANYRLKGSWRSRWIGLPALDNIVIMREGMYEYAALFWYSLTL